ncbi:cytidine deaminase [Drosophila grimshawi]|uniref:Cytidine deaminase n=1 Tax=Drosophila grimshawi TaxID=7222 RepID=B4JB37_DROGR|nr:cytidine deaminase [Drosophila grimshawi]EDW03929.1 GH11514 [Drosophila grimshawi]
MSDLMKGLAQPEVKETVVEYGTLDTANKELLLAAHLVRQRAYAPYSHFKVGSAFRTSPTTNRIFTGCNVENAAFTPTSCAERTALTKAVSEGYQQFAAGAVVAYKPDVFVSPCGVCRQFIREFAGSTDIPIYIAQARDERSPEVPFASEDPVLCTSIFNLLPNSFHAY